MVVISLETYNFVLIVSTLFLTKIQNIVKVVGKCTK